MMAHRCIIVDDEPLAIEVIENYLGQFEGFEVVATCKNATEAISALRGDDVDLVFLDTEMPGMKGTDAVRHLRSQADFADKPIIALSANAMQAQIDEGMAAGFDAYLTKPLDISLLMKELEKVFGTVVVED